jgi:hypothetical protein
VAIRFAVCFPHPESQTGANCNGGPSIRRGSRQEGGDTTPIRPSLIVPAILLLAGCATTTSDIGQVGRSHRGADTSDKISTLFLDLLNNLNEVSGPNFKGCDWQTSDPIEIDRFLRDPLNGKPFGRNALGGSGSSESWEH